MASTPAAPLGLITVSVTAERAAVLRPLEELEHGWDGDGAPAPSTDALERTRALLDRIRRQPDEVDADAIGGIALWFYSGASDGRKLMVGIHNEDGRSVLCSYEHEGAVPKVDVFSDDGELLARVSAQIVDFA